MENVYTMDRSKVLSEYDNIQQTSRRTNAVLYLS